MNKVVPKILELLLNPNTNILDGIFQHDTQRTVQAMTRAFSQFIGAELYSIFLVRDAADIDDEPDEPEFADKPHQAKWDDVEAYLEFSAGHATNANVRFSKIRYPLGQFVDSGILDEAFQNGSHSMAFGDETNDLIESDRVASLSATGQCQSILAVPIQDPRGGVIGVVEIANKTDENGEVVPAESENPFTEQDVEYAESLARDLFFLLESNRVFQLYRKHIRELNNAQSSRDIYDIILKMAVELLHGDRGDLVLWDRKQNDLIVKSTRGPGRVSVGTYAPRSCIVRKVWSQNEPQCISPVAGVDDYYQAHADVKSEIAIGWECEGTMIGVLNVESFQPKHFQELDVTLLNLLLQQAGIELQVYRRALQLDAGYRDIVEEVPGRNESLQTILETAREIFGFGACLLYLVDYANDELYCEKWVGCLGEKFRYKLDEKALATEVFAKKGGIYIADAESSAVEKGVPNPAGLDKFGIKGALVGVPLIYCGKPIGVLVVWHSEKPDFVEEAHIKMLEPFTRLAAAHIAVADAIKRREIAQKGFRRLQQQLQVEASVEKNLDTLLGAVAGAGFDRVRLFEFHGMAGEFECRKCLGGQDVGGQKVRLATNPYARDTVETAKTSPDARVYDPTTDTRGADPDCERLGKPRDLPWAVVPLVIGGQVVGQIVADKAINRGDIPRDSINYLTLLGALAAQAIATERLLAFVSAKTLPMLYDQLRVDDNTSLVIRRLLIYVTCHEVETLGFSRALFFEPNRRLRRLECIEAVGSIDEGRHLHVVQVADERGIGRLLEEAERCNDHDIKKAVQSFWIDSEDSAVASLLKNKDVAVQSFVATDEHRWVGWVRELGEKIGSDHFLAVPIRDETEVWGLLVVDRKWLPRPITDEDGVHLATLAKQSSRILAQHHLHQQLLETRDLSTLGFIAKGLTHDLRQPISVIERDSGTLIEAKRDGDGQKLQDCLGRLERNSKRIVKTVRALESLLRPEENYVRTDIDKLFEQVSVLCKKRAENYGVKFTHHVEADVREVVIIPGLVLQAVVNLIANAQSAVEKAEISGGLIELTARREPSWLVIEVKDNGPGVPSNELDEIKRNGSVYTSNPQKGLGFGLQIVRNVARVHNGFLELINNDPQQGACARIYMSDQAASE